MPRGRKAVIHYEEEIAKLDSQIAKCKDTLAQLQARRKHLADEKKKKDLGALCQAVEASGMSMEEVLAVLSKQKDAALQSAG